MDSTAILNADGPAAQLLSEALPYLVPCATAYIGFLLGSMKFFREQQLRVYEEVLPTVLRFFYNPRKDDEKSFNAGIAKAWIYFSRNVALHLEKALARGVDPKRGDFTPELKGLVLEMRKDIQPILFRWRKRRLKATDIAHFYATLQDNHQPNPMPPKSS